jgi:hypothetical protein
MATVKIHYDDSALKMENCLKEKRGPLHLTTEHLCQLEGVTWEFSSLQRQHNSRGNNAIHLIQSWSPKESRALTPEQVHEMGVELVGRFAPGHQYVVQTHTDQPHAHNHILLNPLSLETGKRIQNKLGHIETLRNLNDDIARERGLSVLPPQEKLRRSGPNEKALRINRFRGRSYIVDLVNKADFARHHATSYDDYAAILGSFDIDIRVEPKNITYFYPGREHGKRGRRLAPALDKEKLEAQFHSNREAVRTSPGLRKTISEIAAGYTAAQERATRPGEVAPTTRDDAALKLLPPEELRQAKLQSILRYCEREKIAIETTGEGRHVLHGREFVEISDYTWINHRNKTRGNAIDFVAHHRQTSYLHAISILNNNPRLMLLEDHLGVHKKAYQSFYFPKEDGLPRSTAIGHLVKLIGHAPSHKVYPELFKRQLVHVTAQGGIRMLPERDPTGYVEYIPNEGRYQRRVVGEVRAPFFERRGRGEELQLFVDPATFLRRWPDAMLSRQGKISVLALLEPNLSLACAASTERSIKRVRLVCDRATAGDPEMARFRDELARALDPFSIDVTMAWEPTRENSVQGRDLDAGPELGRSRCLPEPGGLWR